MHTAFSSFVYFMQGMFNNTLDTITVMNDSGQVVFRLTWRQKLTTTKPYIMLYYKKLLLKWDDDFLADFSPWNLL
jgi:hypothetical protein